jgi:DNA-binding NarL/FixJ family response regulator
MRTAHPRWQANRMNVLRCVVVDDDTSFLEAAKAMLEADGATVVETASSTSDAVQRVNALHPEVVLVDIRLGEESGFDTARKLATCSRAPVVIMISTHSGEDYADLLMESPVICFLPKAELSGAAIRRILGRN